MPIEYIGRTLFPHQDQWRQRQRLRNTFYTLLTAILFAAIVAGIMVWLNTKR